MAAPRNLPMALVAVTNPLPEDPLPPKRGVGYVELGAHVVCSLGLEDGFVGVATCLTVTGLLVVVGRLVVEVTSGVSRPRLCSRDIDIFNKSHKNNFRKEEDGEYLRIIVIVL